MPFCLVSSWSLRNPKTTNRGISASPGWAVWDLIKDPDLLYNEGQLSTELATTVMTGLPWADSGEAVIAAMRQLGRPHSLTIAYRPDLASRGYGVLLWDLWDRHGWEGGNLLGRLLVSSAPMEVEARGHNSQGVE